MNEDPFGDFCIWLFLAFAFSLSAATMVGIIMIILRLVGVVDDFAPLRF